MREELASGLGRHEHIAVLITEILAAAVATSGGVIVVQPNHASRNQIIHGLWHGILLSRSAT
jgi:hypothetical protein